MLRFISKANSVYKGNYSFKMNIMQEIFEIVDVATTGSCCTGQNLEDSHVCSDVKLTMDSHRQFNSDIRHCTVTMVIRDTNIEQLATRVNREELKLSGSSIGDQ